MTAFVLTTTLLLIYVAATLADRVVTIRQDTAPCPGPLVWFDVQGDPPSVLLECGCCGHIFGNLGTDEKHMATSVMREGTAA